MLEVEARVLEYFQAGGHTPEHGLVKVGAVHSGGIFVVLEQVADVFEPGPFSHEIDPLALRVAPDTVGLKEDQVAVQVLCHIREFTTFPRVEPGGKVALFWFIPEQYGDLCQRYPNPPTAVLEEDPGFSGECYRGRDLVLEIAGGKCFYHASLMDVEQPVVGVVEQKAPTAVEGDEVYFGTWPALGGRQGKHPRKGVRLREPGHIYRVEGGGNTIQVAGVIWHHLFG